MVVRRGGVVIAFEKTNGKEPAPSKACPYCGLFHDDLMICPGRRSPKSRDWRNWVAVVLCVCGQPLEVRPKWEPLLDEDRWVALVKVGGGGGLFVHSSMCLEGYT